MSAPGLMPTHCFGRVLISERDPREDGLRIREIPFCQHQVTQPACMSRYFPLFTSLPTLPPPSAKCLEGTWKEAQSDFHR